MLYLVRERNDSKKLVSNVGGLRPPKRFSEISGVFFLEKSQAGKPFNFFFISTIRFRFRRTMQRQSPRDCFSQNIGYWTTYVENQILPTNTKIAMKCDQKI